MESFRQRFCNRPNTIASKGKARVEESEKHKEGEIGEHDDNHSDGDLLDAAIFAADPNVNRCPWNGAFNDKILYHKTYRQRLVISCALLVAEIERVDRLTKNS